MTIDQLEASDQGLHVTVGGDTHVLSWRWIYDHGEDPESFDHRTGQRRVFALNGPEPAPAIDTAIETIGGERVVRIAWPDLEPTWISEQTLCAVLASPPAPRARPWNGPSEALVTPVAVEQMLAADSALSAVLSDLATYGFCRLTGFVGDHAQVEALAQRLGYVQTTIFGSTWELASDLGDHDDTAYSQTFLAPHTDGTYSDNAPGLQMFCCVERSGTGGESIIVDGLAIAETLRSNHPEDFAVLTSTLVPAHYREPGVELRASREPIRLDEHGRFAQISMNNYDRSPMALPPAEMDAFYRAYGRLHELANDTERWVSIRLEPGDVLVNDNWRVLHGRQSYTGARRFFGCYVGHEAFESKVRTFIG